MKISLIVPVYNVENYLRKCLDSALHQSWEDYEIVIVDDGSTDGSSAICQEYCHQDARIRLIRQENQGLSAAWMRGFQESAGEYITFLDSDDWIEPDYLSRMGRKAEGADMVCCAFTREYPEYMVLQREEIPPGRYGRNRIEKEIFPQLINNGKYLGRGITPHRCGKLFRRKRIEENLRWCDPHLIFGEDFNIFFPVLLDCEILEILDDRKGLYHYRQNPSSILRSYKKDMFAQVRSLYRILGTIGRTKAVYDFASQISRDARCLFMEYVKNEAAECGGLKDSAQEILRNYGKMKYDFMEVPKTPLCLRWTDRILECCLEQRTTAGVEAWMHGYFLAKRFTGGTDWKYRHGRKISARPLQVVMAGPDRSVCGGIRTVVGQYLSWKKWNNVQIKYIPVYVEGSFLYKIWFFLRGFLRIWRLCLAGRIDILHLHMAERGSFYRKALILLISNKWGIKTVMHHHGAEFLQYYDESGGLERAWISWTLEHADLNLVLGKDREKAMRSRFPRASFQIFQNAVKVPSDSLYCRNARGLLLTGRLGKRKGVYDLLRAVAACNSRLDEDIKLYLCGDGEIEKVRKEAERLGIAGRLAHVGWVSSPEMEEMYRSAMIFVLPSYHEGMPMALLEAMAHGIPCITGDTDAVPEVIKNGENGVLIKPGDITGLSRVILHLADDTEYRTRLGRRGYRTVKEAFNIEHRMEELEKIYQMVTSLDIRMKRR